MLGPVILFAVMLTGTLAWLSVLLYRERRRSRLFSRPFSPAWRTLLERHVPIYRRLPPASRRELEGHIQVFLDEKRFEGAGGLTMTDEIRLIIAAQACVLLLHRVTNYYSRLRSIIVYPHAYEVPRLKPFSGAHHLEETESRLGESWPFGAVVLAWDHVKQSALDPGDGRNLVFHEFAHQLDAENAASDGIPVLPRTSRYIVWARVLGAEYRDLQERVQAGGEGLLDRYGATNAAEFFAVATECFFERPVELRARHPRLYAELQTFYRQDPVTYQATEAMPVVDA